MSKFSLRLILIGCMICFGSLCHAESVLQIRTQSGVVPTTHEGLHAALWMQTSAEYRILCKVIFNQAKQAFDSALEDKNWTAYPGPIKDLPRAVVLDIDETVLDNSLFQGEVAKEDVGYVPALWTEWVNLQKCQEIPGAVDFLKYIQQKNADLTGKDKVTVVFITNRDFKADGVKEATRNNLTQLGIDPTTPDTLLMQNQEKDWVGSDKSKRRDFVASTHRILLMLGDDLGDFVSVAKYPPEKRIEIAEQNWNKWGTKWFLLPNPAYGSWEGSLYGFDYDLKRPAILKKKWDVLRGFK